MRRAGVRAALGTAVVVVLVAVAAVACAPAPAPDAATPPAAAGAPHPLYAGGFQDPATDAAIRPATTVTPVRLRIPSIGVDSTLEGLEIDGAGVLTPPVDYDQAGWFAGGVVPGRLGPAIIAGHVDSPTAPAVFYRLAELEPGTEIDVDLSDGTTAVFSVTGSVQSAKAEFPTSDVYSTVPRPELRLITCAGAFDRAIGHYTDNLIVFAALSG